MRGLISAKMATSGDGDGGEQHGVTRAHGVAPPGPRERGEQQTGQPEHAAAAAAGKKHEQRESDGCGPAGARPAARARDACAEPGQHEHGEAAGIVGVAERVVVALIKEVVQRRNFPGP